MTSSIKTRSKTEEDKNQMNNDLIERLVKLEEDLEMMKVANKVFDVQNNDLKIKV